MTFSTTTLYYCCFIALLFVAVVEAEWVVNTGYSYPSGGPKKCLASKFRPSNFTVENDPDQPTLKPSRGTREGPCTPTQKIFLTHPNGTKHQFFMKGMGYSPIFPSKYTLNHTFDYYTSQFRYLWNRDLDKIKDMGANMIRVWNWDVAQSHQDFLDLLHEKGMYILVPFDSFTIKNYPDLTDLRIREQILMDWRAFLKSVMYYPAVLGFMIGNELNRHFGAQREGLFSIINNMMAIRNEIDPARHPVTLPLADSGDFKASWIKSYYNWAAIDFWSIQSYRPDKYATLALIKEYYEGYLKHSLALPLKPLVFTEFGTDSLTNMSLSEYLPPHIDDFPKPVVDERKQAEYLCEIFSVLRDTTSFVNDAQQAGNRYCDPIRGKNTTSAARVVAGAVLMEWNDEWWKAQYADVRARMCPSSRPEIHNLCAHNIGDNTTPNYIHEEWLGLTSQVADSTEDEACLCPRLGYYVMKQAFQACNQSNCIMPRGGELFCNFNIPDPDSLELGDINCTKENGKLWCATQPGIMRRPLYSVAGPVAIIFLVLLVVSIKLRYYSSTSGSGNNGYDDEEGDPLSSKANINRSGGDNSNSRISGYGTLNRESNSQAHSGGSDSQNVSTYHQSFFPHCKEKTEDTLTLQRELEQLKQELARAFSRFSEITVTRSHNHESRAHGDSDEDVDNAVDDETPPNSKRMLGAGGGLQQQQLSSSPSRNKNEKTTCHYFLVSQERLLQLVWDKYCSMEHGTMLNAVGTVFRQMMEGYHIYRQQDANKDELENLEGMLEDLALYSIVQTWAGTINHCPEKVCEIFEFSRQYFNHCVPKTGDEQAAIAVKDFHHGLVEVMRVYYLKVDQAEFSYDDVNTDALIFRKLKDEKEIELFWKQEKEDAAGSSSAFLNLTAENDTPRVTDLEPPQPTLGRGLSTSAHAAGVSGDANAAAASSSSSSPSTFQLPNGAPELKLLPTPPIARQSQKLHPYLEYHKQSNPEDMLLSYFATRFFALHAIITKEGTISTSSEKQQDNANTATTTTTTSTSSKGVRYKKFMDRDDAFPLNGGPFTLLFNYGWIVRYLLWQWIIARFFQPVTGTAPMCVCELTKILALCDSGWQFLSGLFHRRILGKFNTRVIFEVVFYGLCFGGLIAYNFFLDIAPIPTPPATPENLFLAGMTANTFYVIATILITAFDEVRLLVRAAPPFEIPARFTHIDSVCAIRMAFVVVLFIVMLAFGVAFVPYGNKSESLMSQLGNMESLISIWPNAIPVLATVILVIAVLVLPWLSARVMASIMSPGKSDDNDNDDDPASKSNKKSNAHDGYTKMDDDQSPLIAPPQHSVFGGVRPEKVSRALQEEAAQLGANLFFWSIFFFGNFMFNFGVLIPAVKNIDFTLCECDEKIPQFDRKLVEKCTFPYEWTCGAAVIFTWVAAALVSFTVMYSVFAIELLIAGFFRAKYLRIGNIKTWEEVEEHWHHIHEHCLPRLSAALDDPGAYTSMWNTFIDALYKDSLLSSAEVNRLKCPAPGKAPNLRIKPRSEEAFRRITYHLWSLESALNHKPIGTTSVHTKYRERHRVRTMPPWTVLVPCYDETVIFDEKELTNQKVAGKNQFRISTLEYLVHTYPDEWDNFAERMKQNSSDKSWVGSKDSFADDLMQSFLRTPGSKPIPEDLRFEIRWWATMRGQTLARTIAGLVNWRDAIVALMRIEEGPDCSEAEIQAVASRKCQVLISHQTAKPFVTDVTTAPMKQNHEEALELTFRRLKHFEVAYNDDGKFQSIHKKVKPEVLASEWGQQDVKYLDETVDVSFDGITVQRKKYNFYRPQDYDYQFVQRVGRLRIGEGKAENQIHALQFVRGAVLQAMDMNQYTTTENGFKVPYLLCDYFGTPAEENDTKDVSIIPEFRILGFPEWAYTRSLSMVGEFMGAAEWCFVTITQRVLDWPLRIRAHYGHPDFFDAYWVRNRGGQSKASRLVNTNEDIFAAYEMFGRGDKGAFVEFLEAQKGRESTFGGACVFEAKLAQGGAQQVRSYDLYRLNRNMNMFDRFGLCFSSLAFYFTNVVMAISVMYYMLSIALFAVSGVSFHELGLMDSAIAVPWLFQIGYVLALPYVMELAIQHGFLKGFVKWLRNLIPAIIFFVFHLRTKMYFFSLGILMGKGGYSATGRGFGLDRTSLIDMFKAYSASHFKEGLIILAVLGVYAVYGSDPVHVYLLRCASILVIVVSWMWAPVIFNPVSTASDFEQDVGDFVWWMVASRRPALYKSGDIVTLESLEKRLKSVHVGRVLQLVNQLENECREVIQAMNRGDGNTDSQQGAITANSSEQQSPMEKAKTTSANLDTKSQDNFKFHDMLVSDAPQEADDINDAFNRVLDGLAKGKPKLEAALKKLTGGELKAPPGDLAKMMNEYWGDAEKESWIGWYLKGDIMLQWEAEDQFFPGLLNLTTQKALMNIELMAPWIILASDRFQVAALWFLGLIVSLILLSRMVDWGFAKHHEHAALGKATLLLPIPFAIAYYIANPISFAEFFWSLVMFDFFFVFALRTYFGFGNAHAKYTTYGWTVRPFMIGFEALTAPPTAPVKERLRISVTNRSQETENTNTSEEKRLQLFASRMSMPGIFLHQISVIVPVMSLVLMCIGNFLIVLMSGWITTMNLNGRVSEAWKKAYLRPTSSLEQGSGSSGSVGFGALSNVGPGSPMYGYSNQGQQQQGGPGFAGGIPTGPSGGVGGYESRGVSSLSAAGGGGNPTLSFRGGDPYAYDPFGSPQGGVGGTGGGGGRHLLNRDMEQYQAHHAEISAAMGGSISASLVSGAGASMRAVRSRARGAAASQSILGRGMNSMIALPNDGASDAVSVTQEGMEPFMTGTTSRILMGDQAGTSSRNLGRR